jgi:hypothetical protein
VTDQIQRIIEGKREKRKEEATNQKVLTFNTKFSRREKRMFGCDDLYGEIYCCLLLGE